MSIPIEKILPNPLNPRSETDIISIMESLQREGQHVPIIVYPKEDNYVLIDGERRFRAAKRLNWKTLKAEVMNVDEKTALQLMISINMQRKNYNEIEKAKAIKLLREQTDMSWSQIAKQYGYQSKSAPFEITKLLDAHPKIQEAFAQTNDTPAYRIIYELTSKIQDPEKQLEVFERIKDLPRKMALHVIQEEKELLEKPEPEKVESKPERVRQAQRAIIKRSFVMIKPEYTDWLWDFKEKRGFDSMNTLLTWLVEYAISKLKEEL